MSEATDVPPLTDAEIEAYRQDLVRRKLAEMEAEAIEELQALHQEIKRRQYFEDPVLWASERLGDVLWSAQRRIIEAVRKYRRVAVMSSHEIGKSYIAALTTAWWLDINTPGDAFVVTSAPTAPQVKAILWREIGRVHARGGLGGRTNQTEWYMKSALGNEELVAFGRKPDEYDPTAFQGIHARRVLVIFDEANGIRGALHEAADSLIANDQGKMLCISNPDDPSGEFYESTKPGSGWHVISVSAFESPNFTGEVIPERIKESLIGKTYVEEKRKKWAPKWHWVDKDRNPTDDISKGILVVPSEGVAENDSNPMWQSKILGVFPEISDTGGLIPLAWVKAAQTRELKPGKPIELGVDVGGGGDANSICLRQGSVYRIIRSDRDPDTMSQCGKVIADKEATHATLVKIDKIGIGWGIVNRGQELKQPFEGINVSEEPSDEEESSDERFANLKAELWWHVRTLFETGSIDIDPFDDDLAAELISVRYGRRSNGKIQILNKKKDASGKTISSPNRAESLMLAAAKLPIRAGTTGGYVW